MARTIVGVGDPKAVKRWSGLMAVQVSEDSYFQKRFMGIGAQAHVPVQILTELESDAGEQISYDLLMQLNMAPVEGDDTLEGKEEGQKFYTDMIWVDQARGGVNTGGAMTRKRTLHNLRALAKTQQGDWWARFQDQLLFVYLSGARGINDDFILPMNYSGRAKNPLVAPDANHLVLGGAASAKTNLAAADKFSLSLIDKAVTRAETQGGGATGVPILRPCKIDGNESYVCVMHPYQENDLRKNAAPGEWLDIQKAAASAEGRNSPLFKGALGMYRGVVLHSHRNVIRFNDYGAGGNVDAARALFMGAQAAVVAFGSPGSGLRFNWNEETRDNGNQVVITSSSIFGTKKVAFETEKGMQDFGCIAIDTAAAAS